MGTFHFCFSIAGSSWAICLDIWSWLPFGSPQGSSILILINSPKVGENHSFCKIRGMEYVTFKENGTVQEEIKNQNSFVMSSESPLKRRKLENFINAIKRNTIRLHNCSAFIIWRTKWYQTNQWRWRALVEQLGVPMLGVWRIIASLIVVSWLPAISGGIKLGAGGLIRAYAGSVAQAVREWTGRNQRASGSWDHLSYSQYQEFANFLKTINWQNKIRCSQIELMTTIFVDKENTNSITAALVRFYNGKVIIEGPREFVRLKYPCFL